MARTELRLALVIEGGVSLAVWMSGVVHEVDLLRRAGSPQRVREPQGGYPDTAFGCWQRLCDELDVDVVVDVISGTSAGGVNGAILACAAAAGHELPALKDLWLEAAQLERGKLLRKVARDAPPALLSGDYFEQQLGTAIDPALAGGPCTDGGPVTLLTTATALGEQFTVWTDTAGQPFDVADHRRVYRFRHDPGHLVYATPADGPLGDIDALFRSEPLTDLRPATAPAVTRAVRATACFPGAFEPVKNPLSAC